MTDIAIRVENLGKEYKLGSHKSGDLRESFTRLFQRNPSSVSGLRSPGSPEDFWALKDVSFEIKQGEAVGIIGRNGAGKSTLLKILSRITEPTKGRFEIFGRVSSLLEVGTGFHPELTGRENVYLNGTILGMRRVEVKAKFDEIVAFSGVEKFIDTPVKHYSSGMQVRLAFAVAAHLEPEILIIDEVLAVGDAEFQKKCLGKMEDVTGQGRTVLFVSHNMGAVKLLCSSGLYILNGRNYEKMGISEAIGLYSTLGNSVGDYKFPIVKDDLVIHNIEISQNKEFLNEFSGDEPVNLLLNFELKESQSAFRIGFFIKNQWGELMARKLPSDWEQEYENLNVGKYIFKAEIPKSFLTAGAYTVEVHASIFGCMDYGLEELTQRKVTIKSPSNFNRSRVGEKTFPGYLLWNGDFHLEKVS